MKIIVDAFGGDNAPLEVIKGSRSAKDDLGVDIALVGDKEKIFSCAAQNKISLTGIDIIDAPDVIAMTDQPGEILKSKKTAPWRSDFRLLRTARATHLSVPGQPARSSWVRLLSSSASRA